MITVGQIKAARGLLNWSQLRTAQAAGLDLATMIEFERGRGVASATAESVKAALESAGVVFSDSDRDGRDVRLGSGNRQDAEWAWACYAIRPPTWYEAPREQVN